MPPVTINISKELQSEIDAAVSSANMSRSAWIVTACKAALSDTAHEGERTKALNNEIIHLNQDLGFMRLEFSKINDILAQKLLTESTDKKPRRSFFDWLRSK